MCFEVLGHYLILKGPCEDDQKGGPFSELLIIQNHYLYLLLLSS